MKVEVVKIGRIELTKEEITLALREWLKTKHNYNLNKAVYTTEGNDITKAVFEVNGVVEDESVSRFGEAPVPKEPVERQMPSGWSRKNIGVFRVIKDIIKEARAKGEKEMDYETMFKEVTFMRPLITNEKLKVYLHDKRQLKGVTFSSKTGTKGGIINF